MKRILFTGSRQFNEVALIRRVVGELPKGTVVIHGACQRGTDKHVHKAAVDFGLDVRPYPAPWGQEGKSAGPERNQRMIDDGKPDAAIAFWDGLSPGTEDCLTRLVRAGIDPIIYWKHGTTDRVKLDAIRRFGGMELFQR